jgi:hypothetical protein
MNNKEIIKSISIPILNIREIKSTDKYIEFHMGSDSRDAILYKNILFNSVFTSSSLQNDTTNIYTSMDLKDDDTLTFNNLLNETSILNKNDINMYTRVLIVYDHKKDKIIINDETVEFDYDKIILSTLHWFSNFEQLSIKSTIYIYESNYFNVTFYPELAEIPKPLYFIDNDGLSLLSPIYPFRTIFGGNIKETCDTIYKNCAKRDSIGNMIFSLIVSIIIRCICDYEFLNILKYTNDSLIVSFYTHIKSDNMYGKCLQIVRNLFKNINISDISLKIPLGMPLNIDDYDFFKGSLYKLKYTRSNNMSTYYTMNILDNICLCHELFIPDIYYYVDYNNIYDNNTYYIPKEYIREYKICETYGIKCNEYDYFNDYNASLIDDEKILNILDTEMKISRINMDIIINVCENYPIESIYVCSSNIQYENYNNGVVQYVLDTKYKVIHKDDFESLKDYYNVKILTDKKFENTVDQSNMKESHKTNIKNFDKDVILNTEEITIYSLFNYLQTNNRVKKLIITSKESFNFLDIYVKTNTFSNYLNSNYLESLTIGDVEMSNNFMLLIYFNENIQNMTKLKELFISVRENQEIMIYMIYARYIYDKKLHFLSEYNELLVNDNFKILDTYDIDEKQIPYNVSKVIQLYTSIIKKSNLEKVCYYTKNIYRLLQNNKLRNQKNV